MKRIISVVLAVLLLSIATVTVFAEDNITESTEEKTYSSLTEAKKDVSDYVFRYEEYFFKYGIIASPDIPVWSEQSSNNLADKLNYVNSTVKACDTIEEVVELKNLLIQAESEMCIAPFELEWMLEYLKKDYESVGYYDEDTTVEIKAIYEKAQSDYASGNEKQIHLSYVSLRNLLNELCLYNRIPGDVNNDGKLTIDDVTLMQKDLVGLTQFNSSQNYIAYFSKTANIDTVTNWQKDIINLSSNSEIIIKEIDTLTNLDIIDPDIRYYEFDHRTESYNYMFLIDRYFTLFEG